ncbi:DUF3616 domain-containing protein [Corallococcus carmarthensis]|uniref:DUF3616 domain-containing protein n=1 Tax=Corallococcus carmarthensis TaxID=2316728 RepID=A0A3A8K928_9BACT|nr:DUF3616 domain-containing protein [Corallococcus carmarthensis]RKH04580.1 DUF3616 domain-containing protein [Corallococcus carmarthensis]
MRGSKRYGQFAGWMALLWLGGCGPTEANRSEQAGAALASAQTTSFQDGVSPSTAYAGTRDAMIEEEDSDANHGTDTRLSASGDTPAGSGNENYVLLQWDVSAIPANATVRSASIVLSVTDKADQSYGFFEVTRAWTEKQVTWERADSSHDWASNGADGAGDRSTVLLGAIRAASTGTYTVPLNAQGLAVVQKWVGTPGANHGVIIADKDLDNRLEVRSREDSTRTSRPKLVVTWDLDGPVPGTGSATYTGTCDGSAGVALEGGLFLNLNDESQTARLYARGQNSAPAQTRELNSMLGLSSSDEADFEDAARVGNRIFVTTSQARNKNGVLQASRYKFFALDVSGTAPQASLQFAGVSSNLLKDLLDGSNWTQPDAAVLSLLQARSRLSESTVAELAPKEQGTNVEGLAALPSGGLAIGFRNPQVGSSALVVTLTNPDAVVTGSRARFGQAIRLELGGQGIRGMAWSEAHQAVLVLSGPHDETPGPFALWKWSGVAGAAPVKVRDLTAPSDSSPEAVIPVPGTRDVQVLFDMGAHLVGGAECKEASVSSQSFTDAVFTVE